MVISIIAETYLKDPKLHCTTFPIKTIAACITSNSTDATAALQEITDNISKGKDKNWEACFANGINK